MGAVLLAEDNLDHQRALAEVLRRLGHEVTVAPDGRAGLDAAAEHPFDLVVADIDMPVLNGLQMCRELRADPRLEAVPIVVITALAPPDDRDLTGGVADAVLRKPFTVAELTTLVRRWLPDPAEAAADEPVERPATTAFTDALLACLDVAVAAADQDGRLVLNNDHAGMVFGRDGIGASVRQWSDRHPTWHPDGRRMAADELPLARALAGERVRDAAMLANGCDGRPRWFTANACPVTGPSGEPQGAVVVAHDVTAERRAQQYQQCQAEVLKVLAGTPHTDVAGRQLLAALATTLGWPYMRLWQVDPAAGRLRPVAIHSGPGEAPLPLPHSFARGEGLAGVCWERGDLVWVPDLRAADAPVLPEVAAAGVYHTAGAVPVRSGDVITGVITFFTRGRQEPEPGLALLLTGIAGSIGAYLERRRADELALQLAATTDDYIALVGHDLRTPLTSISVYTDLIAESPDHTPLGEVRDLLSTVTRNTAELRRLVDRLLDLAAIESGHADFAVTEVDLAALAAAAVAGAQSTAAARGITVTAELPDRLPVTGDAARLRQVLDHLLDNAVTHSPDGATVLVTARADERATTLTVVDHGEGIPAGEEDAVFRRLYRGANTRHAGIPGNGLGLALTRAILGRHRGSVTLRAGDDGGTVATVRLPGGA